MGIGGIGMSGIAMICAKRGYTVSGCDLDLNQHSISLLKSLSCSVAHGHLSPICHHDDIDCLVYSTAIFHDHPELTLARTKGIRTMHRSQMLAELMQGMYTIAVTGSHGKTTTSSLIAHITTHCNQDPTVVVGGHIHSLGSNARYGKSQLFVAEADESDRSMVNLPPSLAVITNIDLEHLETYSSLDDIKNTFLQFIQRLPMNGKVVLNIDDEHTRTLMPQVERSHISCSVTQPADVQAVDILLHASSSEFTILHNGIRSSRIHLALPGIYNVANATAAYAACLEIGIDSQCIIEGFATFTGVDRRFTYKGIFQGAAVFDDYGHHPTEIAHAITVARKKTDGKLILVFQPHRYSRTGKLWNLFLDTLSSHNVDYLIITDIYAASEAPVPGVTSKRLVQELQAKSPHMRVVYQPCEANFSSIKENLSTIATPEDLILLQGAGRLYDFISYI